METADDPEDAVLPAGVEALLEGTGQDASGALIRAAAVLFTEQGANRVSLRSIAREAGVNYGLIHRHFGSKEELLRQIVQLYAIYGREFIPDDGDAMSNTESLFHAESGRFAELFLSAVLDGTPPDRLVADASSQGAYNTSIRDHWESRADGSSVEPFDHRVVGAVSMLVILFWDLLAPYLQVLGNFEERDLEEVKGEVAEILKLMISATGPPSSSGPS